VIEMSKEKPICELCGKEIEWNEIHICDNEKIKED